MKSLEAMRRWPLFLVLALSLVLNLVPVWWGMPAFDGWAFDEIFPSEVLQGLAKNFSGGWSTKYPPLHYYLLSILYWPVRAAQSAGLIRLAPAEMATLLFLVGRLFSVLLGTTTIYVIYRCGRLLHDRSTAVMAALVASVVAPFVFYAKTVNLEAAYLFWFVLSLFFFLRIQRSHRLREYLLFAAAAILSVGTKDQAGGLYVLSPLMLLVPLYRYRSGQQPGIRLARVVFDRRLLLSALLAVVLFALIHNLPFNYHGFRTHLRSLVDSSSPYRVYEPTLAGHLAMAAQSLRHLGFALSVPLLLASLAGVGRALCEPRRNGHLLGLLLFGASYYVFFISVIGYNYVRFLLPICLILCFFAAASLMDLVRWKRLPRLVAVAAVSGIVLFGGLRALSVDLLMLVDSRYRAEAWLTDHTRAGETAIAFGRQTMLPQGVRIVPLWQLRRWGDPWLDRVEAEFVVVSPDELSWVPWHQAFYEALSRGELGYELVFLHRGEPLFNLLDTEGISTNLDKLNPEIAIFRRRSGDGFRESSLNRLGSR